MISSHVVEESILFSAHEQVAKNLVREISDNWVNNAPVFNVDEWVANYNNKQI